jgi:hypothetical protein
MSTIQTIHNLNHIINNSSLITAKDRNDYAERLAANSNFEFSWDQFYDFDTKNLNEVIEQLKDRLMQHSNDSAAVNYILQLQRRMNRLDTRPA